MDSGYKRFDYSKYSAEEVAILKERKAWFPRKEMAGSERKVLEIYIERILHGGSND